MNFIELLMISSNLDYLLIYNKNILKMHKFGSPHFFHASVYTLLIEKFKYLINLRVYSKQIIKYL